MVYQLPSQLEKKSITHTRQSSYYFNTILADSTTELHKLMLNGESSAISLEIDRLVPKPEADSCTDQLGVSRKVHKSATVMVAAARQVWEGNSEPACLLITEGEVQDLAGEVRLEKKKVEKLVEVMKMVG